MIFIVDLNRDLNRFKSLDLNHIHPAPGCTTTYTAHLVVATMDWSLYDIPVFNVLSKTWEVASLVTTRTITEQVMKTN